MYTHRVGTDETDKGETMYSKKLYQVIASAVDSHKRCKESGNSFASQWEDTLDTIERDYLPHGSGIDSGTKIDRDKTTATRIVLTFGFHHMDSNGFYCGWTDYTAVITPSFDGIDLRITGRDRNGIKEYLHQTFDYCLNETAEIRCEDCGHVVMCREVPDFSGTHYATKIIRLCPHGKAEMESPIIAPGIPTL